MEEASWNYRNIFENPGKKVIRAKLLSLEFWLTTKYLVTIRKRDFGQQRYCYDFTATFLITDITFSIKKKKKERNLFVFTRNLTREINKVISRGYFFFHPFHILIGCWESIHKSTWKPRMDLVTFFFPLETCNASSRNYVCHLSWVWDRSVRRELSE